jgi:prepilin-type N-terminal cleavage/methylation domain-containing protein
MFIDPVRRNAMLATGYHLDDRDGSLSHLPSAPPAVAPYDRSSITTRTGFTLLEITLAVAILGMMSLAIFRFVQTNLTALRVSSDANAAEAQYDGLRDLLMAEWQSLSPRSAGMKGEPFKLNDRQRDEIKWNCSAGPGLLTRYAAGDFTVSLRLQPENSKSNRLDLGFLRESQEESDIGDEGESWVPLIKNVNTLQILYFDPRLNTWIDRWSDGTRLPRLVKLTVGRADTTTPWEVIIPLGRTPF